VFGLEAGEEEMESSSTSVDEQLEVELRGFNSDTPVATVKRTLAQFANLNQQSRARFSSQTLTALLEVVLIDWLPCFTEQERSDCFDAFFLDDHLSAPGKDLSSSSLHIH